MPLAPLDLLHAHMVLRLGMILVWGSLTFKQEVRLCSHGNELPLGVTGAPRGWSHLLLLLSFIFLCGTHGHRTEKGLNHEPL